MWFKAASIISLLRSANNELTVLMAQRGSKLSFMPNLLVFPGGQISKSDLASDWLMHMKTADKDYFRRRDAATTCKWHSNHPTLYEKHPFDMSSDLPLSLAYRLCAIRECFEESGLLLATSIDSNHKKPSTNELNEWRERIRNDDACFGKMISALKLTPNVEALHEWSYWLTPLGDKFRKRFDTVFYVADCTQLEMSGDSSVDYTETTGIFKETPLTYLKWHCAGKISLAPPQVYELLRLRKCSNVSQVLSSLSPTIERKLPILIKFDDCVVCVLKGDKDYPDEPDFLGTSAKRIQHNFKSAVEFRRSGDGPLHRVEFYLKNRFEYFKSELNQAKWTTEHVTSDMFLSD